jgi:ABC-type polysaccharide/polyol phosphate transport system ATPase subunit
VSGQTPSAPAVRVENLGVRYRVWRQPADRLKQALFGRRRVYYEELWALRHVSLQVERGMTFGIIGPNGGGKSTLLKVIAGLLAPAEGRVERTGRLAALLELGTGFHGEYTGRENVFLNAAMLGLGRDEIEAIYPAVVAFSELGAFMDRPVKTYSTGMFVRLAFAVAAQVEPDILVIDEALAVGDAVFQHRCVGRIKELQRRGTTILFVSHDMTSVTEFCDAALWLDGGAPRLQGIPEAVVKQYLAWVYARQDSELRIESLADTGPTRLRYGNGKGTIERFEILDEAGAPARVLRPASRYTIQIEATLKAAVTSPILGFQIRDPFGREIFTDNTIQCDLHVAKAMPGDRLVATFVILWPELADAVYSVSPALAAGTQADHEVLDWLEGAAFVRSAPERFVLSLIRVRPIEASFRRLEGAESL